MLRWICALGLALLAACGGGGGSGSPTDDSPSNAPISGYVVKGPTVGATVRLHAINGTGQLTLLAQTTTSQDGRFSFTAEPAAGTALLVSAQGGSYTDEATLQSRSLNLPLRAFVVRVNGVQRVSPTPYSELAVRMVERTGAAWTGDAIQAANAAMAEWLGVRQVLDFRPLQLQQPNLVLSGVSEDDVAMSLAAGAFSTFVRRLGSSPEASLGDGLEALHHLMDVDPNDDRLFPAFVGGLLDFVDRMGLTDELKRELKSSLLFDSNMALGDVELGKMTPRGVSSGSATAAMPDDGFRLLGSPGGRTMFNKRGALVGFTTSASTPDWQLLYTASVAELFGDGDIGIGRWNGGGIVSSVDRGGTYVPTLTSLPYDSMHYAVAATPIAAPACGLRRLPLTAHTQPTLLSLSIGAQLDFVDLAPDSQLSLQYLGGGVHLGADIGVRLADGSIVRYRTQGGLDAPWATPMPIGAGAITLEPVAPAGPLANRNMAITALVAGTGARKVAARIEIYSANDPTRTAAAFVGSPIAPESQGCTTVGAPGPGISPRPADGEHYTFLSFNTEDVYRGAPRDATFGPAGELRSIIAPFVLSAPAYELAGNADASIGRVVASGLVNGITVSRSTPYAVVRPGAALPTFGTFEYDLVSASSVMADRGDSASEVPPGTVTKATLTVIHGQYPVSTPNAWYGSAMLRVEGQVGGLPFSVGDPGSNLPTQVRMLGEAFSDNNIQGAVAAPDGEFAAVQYKTGVGGGVPIKGTLLFRRRP